jgi:hypothetical protein
MKYAVRWAIVAAVVVSVIALGNYLHTVKSNKKQRVPSEDPGPMRSFILHDGHSVVRAKGHHIAITESCHRTCVRVEQVGFNGQERYWMMNAVLCGDTVSGEIE